ncbi:MAG: trigger factor [Dysosmobacter sp.]|nr:trigger factor [Dysosmobacter sp.]MDY3867510.1 trigger factor [Dysosmobacter sp.]
MTVKSCEKLEKSQVALTIEVGAAEFEAAVEKAYQKMRRKINVPGFRPGKAPRKMIERMYGAEVFFEEAINIAFPEAYEAAVEQEKLQVVGYPAVEMVGEVTKDGFTFKATAPVYPEVTLGEYKGLKAEKPEVKVTAADVDERLKTLADRNTRLVSVDREAKSGDTAVIDFEGFLNGKPFEGGKGENHNLELGSGSFVPGFEDQVIGMKAGEEKDIDITFPENYHEDLAGKAVVFKVKVHEVKEKEVPEMDDEFAKDVSEFDTLKDLKADLKKKITEERQKDADRAFEENLMNQVAENITADIPDVMVENQARQYLDNFKAQISRQFPYEEYKKMTGMDDEKLLADAKEPALRQVKMDLAVAAIIKAENIEASDEDVEAEYKKMAEQFGMDVDMVKKYLVKEQVQDQLLSQKAVAVVVDSATAEKPKKAAKKEEAAEGEEKKPAKKTTKKAEAAGGEEKPKKAPAKKAAKKEAEKEAE